MQNADFTPVRQPVKPRPFTGRSRRIIRRTQQAVFRFQKRLYFFGNPAVIARRNHVGAAGKQFAADAQAQPEAVRGIIAVDNDEIDMISAPEIRQCFSDQTAARFSDDVPQQQNTHHSPFMISFSVRIKSSLSSVSSNGTSCIS